MHKETSLRKTIAIFLFSIYLAFSPIQARPADAWMTMFGVMAKQFMEIMADTVKGIIIGAMKTVAITVLNEAISDFVGGSSSSNSKVISDYKDFIYTQPQKQTDLYLNDLISQTTGGQSSSSYSSFEGIGDISSIAGGGAGYKTQMANMAKSLIKSQSTIAKPTYVGDPSQNMFSEGNLDNFNSYLSGINNPWAYNLYVQQKYQEKLEQERETARMEALTGQGFRGNKQNGKIITPGSIIESSMSNVLDIGNKSLAAANNPGEVISAVVQQIIMQALQDGIGKVQENLEDSQRNSENSSQAQSESGGPGSQYGNPGTKAEPWTNPDTKSPF